MGKHNSARKGWCSTCITTESNRWPMDMNAPVLKCPGTTGQKRLYTGILDVKGRNADKANQRGFGVNRIMNETDMAKT